MRGFFGAILRRVMQMGLALLLVLVAVLASSLWLSPALADVEFVLPPKRTEPLLKAPQVTVAATTAVALAPAAQPAVPQAAPPAMVSVPVQVLYVSENQPVHLLDSQGRLLEIIYLRRK